MSEKTETPTDTGATGDSGERNDEEEDIDTVYLVAEGETIKSSRALLAKKSDYFAVMFGGAYIESQKNTIVLKDVDATSLRVILGQSEWTENIDNFNVLRVANMLQFSDCLVKCVINLLPLLQKDTCIEFWRRSEHLDITELCTKAKLLALTEFSQGLVDDPFFMDMSLDEVCRYLGSSCLKCENERDVFECALKWAKGREFYDESDLLKLMFCVDFKRIESDTLTAMARDVSHEPKLRLVGELISCMIMTKEKTHYVRNMTCTESCVRRSELLLKAKTRNTRGSPCLLMNFPEEVMLDLSCYTHVDAYRRMLYYRSLREAGANVVIYYLDLKTLTLKELHQCHRLGEGYGVGGFKHYFYRVGGETILGRGNWITDFFAYSQVFGNIELRELPESTCRRHFQTICIGDYMYIVGGFKNFRIKANNVICYNIATWEWWQQIINLPCDSHQIFVFGHKGKLAILDLNSKTVHKLSFTQHSTAWESDTIIDRDACLPPYSSTTQVFSYNDRIFIKGTKLFELEEVRASKTFLVIMHKSLDEYVCLHSSSVLCGDLLYTFCQRFRKINDEFDSETETILEVFDMDTFEVTIKKDVKELLSESDNCSVKLPLNVFSVYTIGLIEADGVINEYNGS